MTIKRIMISLLAVLSILLIVSQGLLFKQAYHSYLLSVQASEGNQAVDDLLDIANSLAAERGVTNSALNGAEIANPATLKKIAELREKSDKDFHEYTVRAAQAKLTIETHYQNDLTQAREKLNNLRHGVDVNLAKPKAERDAQLLTDWMPGITDLIVTSQKLRINLASQAMSKDSALAKQALIRHSVWLMTEYAGRERGMLAGIITSSDPISPEKLQQLLGYRGKVDEGWDTLTNVYLNAEEHAVFDAAIAAAKDNFFSSFEKVRQTAYADAKLGVGYSISAKDWMTQATQAIDTLNKIQDASGNFVDATLKTHGLSAISNMTVYGVTLLIAILAIITALWVVLGRVIRPINAMSASMVEIAEGDYEQPVPYLDRQDEIGGMAQSVGVFRENGIEKIRLQKQQEEAEKNAAIEKKRAMNALADDFESSVKAVVTGVSTSAEQMRGNAERLTTLAGDTQQRSGVVATAAAGAAQTATQVAAAAEELTAAIDEISAQVQKSSSVATQAGNQADSINQSMQMLVEKSNRVGEVIQFITNIASQINLLALNATIESARAGEAGRGFAVVASEVKNLANQTAKATEEIVQQVQSMQEATKDAVQSVTLISSIINEISQSTAGVAAAVEEQSAATNEISRNIAHTASGTNEISQNIGAVQQGAEETGTSSGQVLTAAKALSMQTVVLNEKVNAFLTTVRTA